VVEVVVVEEVVGRGRGRDRGDHRAVSLLLISPIMMMMMEVR
jgi:hypothetical protein